MVCLYCSGETQVVNSRHQKKSNHIWRRRRCQSCQGIFTTQESAELGSSIAVNHSGVLEPFSRDKLFLSIYDSCKHRNTAINDATALVDTIISKLHTSILSATLSQDDLIAAVTDTLKHFDQAAAVHYVAYHPPQTNSIN